MMYFATFFDKNYLSRGIVLYNSLQEQKIDFKLFILCLDNETSIFFLNNNLTYSNVITLSLEDFEFNDAELSVAKNNRSVIEYYFTLSPCLPLYLLKKFELPHICTLDADILFLSSPQSLFNYLSDYSIIITPHKFSNEILEYNQYGTYNVSFQIFKNDACGLQCLQQWRKQCITWCGDYYDEKNNRFADQKYLDTWPIDYPNKVKVLDDSFSGIAPWNLNNYALAYSNNSFTSDGNPLIYYHFQHFKILNKWIALNGFENYKVTINNTIKKLYYLYWKKIQNINLQIQVKKDTSKRVDLSKKIILQLIHDQKAIIKIGNNIFEINTNNLPYFFIRVIRKLYG